LILSNGAIVKRADGTTLLRHLLPRGIARAILGAVPQHRATAALVFDRPREGQIVYERVDWDHPRHGKFFTSNREFIAEIVPLEDALTDDPLQVMFTGGCGAMRAVFEQLLGHAAAMPEDAPAAIVAPGSRADAFSVALTEYLHRDFSLVDVIHAGCSKGSALAEWAGRRGISADAVMAIGDNLNDLDMLTFAGRPVVMANAVHELKARGWRVTASNDDCGVARAIDEILHP
jgi:hydroxymethylpyrimidine pyrophosphatase-like HAD family hydrolase